MKLTPLDIRHKEFKRGMRGYADVEVDEFLDEVADEYERLFKENIDLHDRVESLEEKVTGYKRIEETLQKTLVNAQASAEEQKQNASKQAQLILQDAELKARQMANEAYSERQVIEQNIAKMRSAEQDFRFKFRQLLEGFLRQLQGAPGAESQPAADFAKQAEAIKEAIAREATVERRETTPAGSASPRPETQPGAPATDAERAPAPGDGPSSAEPAPAPEPSGGSASREAPTAARPAPTASPSAPARGRGGVQAGVPLQSEQESGNAAPPASAAGDAAWPGDDAEVTASHAAEATPAEGSGSRERTPFREGDDLLADVDSGVNENEFKW